MYQSGRVGDEAKKRKSPAKSGRVGIYAIPECILPGGGEGGKLLPIHSLK